ncbi:probable 28S ribosomal protein S26, mitochondrial [Athalia rosae]|uniref:probable 28S ribosomal protein S26, mitochondrial n=1 Tax=Athalia rosae TaxID=37344 RepID=UPI0020343170|nr:probable 28S ribosomal protein S26, mitochondrial [Athalia rosae]
MLRSTMMVSASMTNNSLGILSVLPNPICVQSVRWWRKPRWVPMAKSKIFRIPERPKIPVDEQLELKRLHDIYKTHVRSIRRHIRDMIGSSVVKLDEELHLKEEQEDFERCWKINEDWNAARAKEREVRLAEEWKIRSEQILETMVIKDQYRKDKLETIEEKVKQLKEASKHFITADNIDQAIEDALDNPVNYNWAMDSAGTIYRGKYIKPEFEIKDKQLRHQQRN